MVRLIVGVVGGLIAWFVVATIVNLLFRAAWPGYAAVESSMAFDLAMLFGRLIFLGALSSLCGGAVAAWIAKGDRRATIALGVLLTLMFIPVHYRVWSNFPIWYHLAFLVSLLPLTLLGGRLLRRESGGSAAA